MLLSVFQDDSYHITVYWCSEHVALLTLHHHTFAFTKPLFLFLLLHKILAVGRIEKNNFIFLMLLD